MALRVQTFFGIAIVLALPVPSAWAIGTRTGGNPPVVENARPYVGKVQTELTPTTGNSTHICTGSVIDPEVLLPSAEWRTVLTAAHCIHESTNKGLQNYERFTLGNEQHFGLGVRHPQYATVPPGFVNDVALIVVLDGINVITVATVAQAQQLDPNDVAYIVGWSSADGVTANPGPLRGQTDVVTVTGAEYIFDRTTGDNLLNLGDSGGPTFMSATDHEIVGVHSYREPVEPAIPTKDHDMRVDPHKDFIAGKGAGGASTLNYLIGAGPFLWNNAPWLRGGVGTNNVPLMNDVVVLDPTSDDDDLTQLILNGVNTAPLEGLLNDVRLTVDGGATLNVPGRSAVLNGGTLLRTTSHTIS